MCPSVTREGKQDMVDHESHEKVTFELNDEKDTYIQQSKEIVVQKEGTIA